MTKSKCSFPGCYSGCASDRRKNKLLGIRNKTLFKVPKKDSQLRHQWHQALHMEFSDTDALCELHFSDRDISQCDDILLKDGSRYFSLRDKKRISKTGIPSLTPDKCDVSSLIESTSFAVNNDATPEIDTDNGENAGTVSFKNSDTNSDTVLDLNYPIHSVDASASCPIPSVNDCTLPIKKVETWSVPEILATEEYHFYKFMKEKLPNGWMCHKSENLLNIGHYNPETFAIQKQLIVHADSSVMMSIHNMPVKMLNMVPIVTVNDILENVKILRDLLPCVGTEKDGTHSDDCIGYVRPSSESKIRFGHVRCEFCFVARRKSNQREYRRRRRHSRREQNHSDTKKIIKAIKGKNMKLERNVSGEK